MGVLGVDGDHVAHRDEGVGDLSTEVLGAGNEDGLSRRAGDDIEQSLQRVVCALTECDDLAEVEAESFGQAADPGLVPWLG